jgi:hypothetical protein
VTTATATRTRKQPQRSAKVVRLGNCFVLWLTVDKNTTAYRMVPLPSDFGRAVRLEKADKGDGQSETYDVLLDGERSTCECKGFLRHSHCKHVSGIAAVIASGQLADALPEPTEPEGEEETSESAEAPAEPERICFECGRPSHDFYCDKCGNI